MATIVYTCPRCDTQKVTLDVLDGNLFRVDYGWKGHYELYCICRACSRSSILLASQNTYGGSDTLRISDLLAIKEALNARLSVDGFISLAHEATVEPPDGISDELQAFFREGATCIATGCYNAAGAMFRLCVDHATRPLLPSGEVAGLNGKTRRDIAPRLEWLFSNNLLPKDLADLSDCIREDGNDAVHAGNLTAADASDLLDFTTVLLERLYTEPARLAAAKDRRAKRRDS